MTERKETPTMAPSPPTPTRRRARPGGRALLGLAATLALLAAACGGSSNNSGGGTSPGSSSGGQALKGQTLDVVAVWTGAEQANFQKVLDAFEQKTGAKVTFASSGNSDLATLIGTRIKGGKPPDVAILPNPGLMKDLVGQNALKPIDDVAGSLVDANYAPVWRQLGTVNGTLYGLYWKAANKSTVWYNTKVFSDAGVQPATDWPAFLQSLQTISDFGVTPLSIGAADGWPLTDWFENIYLRTAGPDKYDQLADHKIKWTDPTVKQALTTFAQILKPNFLAGGVSGTEQTNFSKSVSQVFTDPPKAAITYEGDFVAGVIESDTTAKVGTDANFFDFPSINGSAPAVVGGGDAAVLLTDKPAAKELIKFLASPEAATVWARLGGFLSPNKKVDPAVYPDDVTRKIATSLANASTFRFDMSDLAPAAFGGTPGQGEFKILQDFLQNPSDVNGTAQALEAAAAKAYGG
jgi:alpha-glucoside transport system substrate-binding protein